MVEAEGAQPCDEIENRARIEAELGDDLHAEPGRLCGRDFRRQRAVKLLIADAWMAAGIAGDADAADAAAAQHAAVDGVNGSPQWPAFGPVAGDDERVTHAGLAVEPGEEIVERSDAGEVAHRDVRHRLETGGTQPHRRGN